MDNETIRLISYQGHQFDIPMQVAELFGVVRRFMFPGSPIPLSEVTSAELAKAIEFAINHLVDPQSDIPAHVLPHNRMMYAVDWAKDMFDDMLSSELIGLYHAAANLEFPILLTLTRAAAIERRNRQLGL